MKRPLISMFVMLLSFTCAVSFAQKPDSRPKLFAAHPGTINLDKVLINNAFSYNEGVTVSLPFLPDFNFSGTVLSNEKVYDNLQTILIRSQENGAVLQITKIINNDKSISFAGRIINLNAADGYEIKFNNGLYSLQKFETANILEPCNL